METCSQVVRCRSAFTLTELLVSIAVIGLLVALIAPALARARTTAKMVRELAAAKQNTATYINYTADFKDAVIPASANWNTIRSSCPAPPQHRLYAPDPFNPGAFVDGSLCKTWFYYLQGWAGTPLAAWQVDRPTYDNFWARPRESPSYGWTNYPEASAATAFGFHPTLGLNGVFMGGSYRHGGLQGEWGLTNPLLRHFYLTRLSQARDPARLTVFSSARGGDVATMTIFWSHAGAYPDSGKIQPGYFLVTPAFSSPNGMLNVQAWSNSSTYRASMVPSTWGNMAFRYFDQACVSAVDGHASTMSIKEMRDMRLWSNYATRADWTFQAGP